MKCYFYFTVSNDIKSNEIEAKCPLIEPITFELRIQRNMAGSKTKEDPSELNINGTLYEIKAAFSRGDYNAIMEIIKQNFNEPGELADQKKSSVDNKGRPSNLGTSQNFKKNSLFFF